MLSPIDIQSKTFKGGLGYDRKEVDNFLAEIVESYEVISQENKDLKRKTEILSNALSQYKTIEKSLQKALLLAQKTSEDIQKQAQAKAAIIEKDARNRAKIIVNDSKNELEHIHQKTLALIHQYELYRAQFEQLARTQVQVLRSESFHISSEEITRATRAAFESLSNSIEPEDKSESTDEETTSNINVEEASAFEAEQPDDSSDEENTDTEE